MYCEIKSKSSSNVIVPEMNRLNRDDLNKIKKEFRDESNKNNYKKILNNAERSAIRFHWISKTE